jgi:hypothetical protein
LTCWKKRSKKSVVLAIAERLGLRAKRKISREKTAGRHDLRIVTAGNAEKGVRGMPRLSEAMKDATSCDKLRVGAHIH